MNTTALQTGPCPTSDLEALLDAATAHLEELKNEFLFVATNPFK